MKRLFCIFLALLLMVSVFSFSAFADGGVTVLKLNKYLQSGEKLSLSVTFNTDMESFAFMYDLQYDTSVLDFINVSGGMCNEYEKGKIRYANVGNGKSDSVAFAFRTKTSGKTDIKITNIYSADGVKEYSYPSVTYSVSIDAATRGDVNGDGKITTTDLAILKLYLAAIEKSISDFADYDKNGTVTTTDLASLKLYLAGC